MRVKFWGVRGSVPYATRSSIGYGCNTPCIELVDDATGRTLVLDAGSGIVGLGDSMPASRQPVPILLTHYHWDHLQGLPFFAPLYRPGGSLTVWAPVLGPRVPDIEAMFDKPFFPIPYESLPSRPSVEMVTAGDTTINGFDIRVERLNHPGGSFAYRIRGASRDLVYATDHEFGDRAFDDALAAFCAGAGAVIFDAHFTPEELPLHKGWGHADWHQAATFAKSCGVGHLWLAHHKPGRTDEALRGIEAEARLVFPSTSAAAEGNSFIV